MRKLISTVFIFHFFFFAFAQESSGFLSQPCLTPDGKTVIFSFEGDLWKSDLATGAASRITAMNGYEYSPRVSPNGKYLAFTGTQMGNPDVYVLPLEGGPIVQLTHHSSRDEVSSWSWDSKTIYFTSSRYSMMAGYSVPVTGGTAKRVFGDYFFLFDHNLWEQPGTGEIFFDDTWESENQAQRKRYRGPFNPDIQSYNPATKKTTRYTSWEGKDFNVSIDRNGKLYFISDEGNSEYNLYTLENGSKKALTSFPESIRDPFVSADGSLVAFEKNYRIWVYDTKSKKSRELPIRVYSNQILSEQQDYQLQGNISAFDISPDGKKLAFVARGELFVSDNKGKFIRQLPTPGSERIREVKWKADSRSLIFTQTVGGYPNLFSIAADGKEQAKQLTEDAATNRSLSMNSDRSKMVYLSGRNEVRLLDLASGKSSVLVSDEIWAFQNSDPGFSPNDEYVYYTAHRNFEQDVFVCRIKDKKITNLTNTGITEADPKWGTDPEEIYFLSQLTSPAYPFGLEDAHIFRLPLIRRDEPFRNDQFDSLFVTIVKDTTTQKKEEKDKKKEPKKEEETKEDEPIQIETDHIMDRLEQVGPRFGRQSLLNVIKKGEKEHLLIVSNHEEGKPALYDVVITPFEEDKTEKISNLRGGSLELAHAKDQYYLSMQGNIYTLNLDNHKTELIELDYTFRRNLQAEFRQMFEEAWAQMNENYYDESFHGTDWQKVRTRYAKYLPYLNNRNDLRLLLNDMLGELNSSHQGFRTLGMDESVPFHNRTMETGIVFQNDAPYLVDHVVRRTNADKSDIDLKMGDKLVSVNGETLDEKMDRDLYFTRPSPDAELRLGFLRNGKTFYVNIHPQGSLFNSLYDEWIDANQARVDKESKGQIAYTYMKNMGGEELEQFLIDMTRELQGKKALIFDLRYNTGGNVHDKVLQFLSQRSYLKWKYRGGSLSPQPNFAPSDVPIILLTNEQSLSDAEMTAQGFKALKLGRVLGNETYHWIIFTSGASLVDGSLVRLPAWGCYSLDGKDLEKTGVTPDIKVINTFNDKLQKKDPQLDMAIELLMKEMK